MTAEIVDVRPDRFLRAMRDTGDVEKSCEAAGLTPEELDKYCQDNPKFDLACLECQMEYIEDTLGQEIQKVFEKARYDMQQKVAALREEAMVRYRQRHG